MAQQIRYGIGFDVKKDGLQQVKKSLKQLQNLTSKDILNLNKNLNSTEASQALKDIAKDAKIVEDALDKAFNVKLNTVNVESFNRLLKESGSSIQQIYANFSKAGTLGQSAFRSMSSQVLSTNIQLKESHAILDKIGTTLGNTLKWNIASSAVNSLTRSIQEAWGYVKSLDTSLNDIRIVTGKSSEEMGNFAKQANEAAENLGRTTTDYTKAALIYAQQGLEDEEIAKRSQITLKAANVTGQSTDAVSEELTAVWNGYKVNAEQAEVYVDRLAAVAATTASNLEQLSTGMSKVAAAANELGVGEDQLAAQLSTIISATRQAPQSVGTALKTVYARISDIKAGIDQDGVTLGKYSGDMANLGINVLDAQGKLRDMGSIIEEVGSKWQGMTREQQISLAQTMAGQRQYSNLMALFGNFDKYTSALNTARNAAGTLQEQQDIYMESTAAHLEQLTASVENIYDSLFNMDGMNGLIDGLSQVAQLVANFVDSLGGGGNILRSLGALGVTVFSEQIAKGINTTLINMDIARENAEQFKRTLQATESWEGIPSLDDVSKKILKDKEQMLELARFMTPEQFNDVQEKFNTMVQSTNKSINLKDQKGAFDQVIQQLTTSIEQAEKKWQDLESIMKDPAGQEEVIKRLKQQESKFFEVTKALEEYKKKLKEIEEIQNSSSDDQTKEIQTAEKIKQMEEVMTSYMKKLNQLSQQGALEQHSQQIAKLNKEVEKLSGPDKTASIEEISSVIGKISGVANSAGISVQELRQGLEQQFQGTVENLPNIVEQSSKKAEQDLQKFQSSINRIQKASVIENFTKLAGGISQVGAAMRQFSEIGRIFNDKDLTSGQKMFQIITNLAMSLPLLINGFTKTATAMGVFSIATEANTAAAIANTTKNFAQAGSFGVLSAGIEGTTVQFTILNTVIKTNVFVALASVVLAAAAAFTAFAKAQEEARKQSIQDSKEKIQENKKIHQQVEAHKQLYKSLKELKEQEDNHQISRGELKSAVQDLVNQYGKEDQSVRNLISSYGDLGQKIKELQYQDAKKRSVAAEQDLKESRNIAKKSIETTEGQRGKDFNSKQIDDKYNASFGNYLSKSKPNQEVLKAFREIGGEDAVLGEKTFGIKFSINYENEEDALKFYEQVKETVEKLNKEVNAETLKDDSTYQGAKEWLKQQKEWAEGLSDAEKNSEKITKIEKVAKEAIRNNEINFDDIETVKQYEAQYEKLVNILGKGEKGKERANEFIRENLEDVYKKFEEPRKFVEDFSKDFAGKMPKSIKDALKNLTPEQYDQLANKLALNPGLINDWDQFKTILEIIAGIDFSNVEKVKQESPDSNKQFFKKQSTEAAATYNQYQPVYEAVQKGESISAQDYEALNPALQEYFNIMYDGTYKMQGDAEQFYQKINNLKISGFSSALDQINNRIVAIENFKNDKDFSYEDLQQNASKRAGDDHQRVIDQDQVRVQLDYLAAVSDGNEELQEHIQTWNQLLEQHQIDTTNATKIAEEITNAGNKSSQFSERQKQLIQQAKQLRYEMARALDPTDEDVDEKEKQRLAKIYEEQADKIDGVNDALKGNKYASEQAAEGVLRFDNAILDVAENYEDWMDILDSGNYTDFLGIADELADAYSDLLDLSGNGLLSDEFLQDKEHLEDMQAALNGDTQAYERLAAAANEDIIAHVFLNPQDAQDFQTDLYNIQSEIDKATAGMNDIQVDARLNDGEFIGKLNELVANTGMSVGQVQALLKNMGYNAVVTQSPPEEHTEAVENEYWVPATYKTGTPIIGGGNNPLNPQQSYTPVELDQPGHFESQPGMTKSITPGAGAVKIEQLHKNGGGEVKYQQASSGSKGKMRRSGGGGGGGKGKKGKGGGGKGKKGSSSKKNEPDKTQKDLQKKLKDERDIYHDINIQIDKINRTLDRTQKKQDRLYGKQLIKNLNEQTKILEKHKKKLEEKNKLQQKDLKNQQKALKNLGVTFNKYGDISNYMSILGKKQKEVNSLVDKQNKLIKQYNAETDKEKKQKINEQIEKIGKQKSTKEEDYKDLKDRIKNYDELREQIQDVKDQIEEETQKQIEIKIEKFRMKIEIRLEMGEAERDWNKFRRDVLEHTDILKDSDFSKNLKDAQLNYADARTYFKVGNEPGSFETLTNQLNQTREQIESINKTGTSSIYGDNKKQAMQHLKSDLNELMSQMEDYESLIDEINEAYLDTIDNVDDYFNKQIEDYEYVGELIQHDMDLLTLLYGDKNYDAMDKYYSKLQSNNLNQIDSLRRQKDFWKQQWDAAAAAGDTNAAQKFKENYKKVIGDLNSLIQDSAQTLQDQYVNSINKIFDELDKKMTKGQGSDYLNMEWDLMQKNANEYLDTINSAFGIQQTERKYQKAIDDSKNLKNQRELKKVMNEQLGILKNKQKLTQYDIDRAQKLLQVEQARIALQDARSAKTSMKLKRDAQGNYSYQYVADDEAVENAESEYAGAVNDLYNFDLDRYKGNLEDMLAAWEEFKEKYIEIQTDVSLTDQQRIERTALLQEQYGEYINGKTQENAVVRNNLRESAFKSMEQMYDEDVIKFQSMTDTEVQMLMQKLVPEWNRGAQMMTTAFTKQGGFLPSCQTAFEKVHETTQNYENKLGELAEKAGVNLGDIRTGTDTVADGFANLIEKNTTMISQMGQQLTEIQKLTTAANSLSKEYKNVYDQAVKATKAIQDFMRAEQARAAAAADAEAKKKAEEAAKKAQQQKKSNNKGQWQSDNYSGMLKSQHNQYVAKLSSQGKNQKNNSFNVDAAIKSGQLEQINGADKNIIMGIAGSILLSKSWGDGQTRRKNMIDVFGEQLGKEMYNRVHEYLRDSVVNNEKYKEDIVKNAKWYQSFDLDKLKLNANTYLKAINSWVSQGNKKAVYDTGGYTGDWNSSEGRPAILHEKELVLNKQDTKNILDSVTIMRSIMASMSGNIISKLGSLTSINSTTSSFGNNSMLQQQVKIQATFPNVNSKKEIEEALSDLVNLAAQRAMRQ